MGQATMSMQAHAARPTLSAVRAHYCTAAQAAKALGVGDRRVRTFAATGVLEGEIVEGRWLVSRASVAALLRARAARGGPGQEHV